MAPILAGRQDPRPPYLPRTTAVRIDAIVTDAQGRPVADLKLGDFELVDSGTSQTIDSVEFRTAAPSAASSPPVRSALDAPDAATPGGRLLALFLDEYHVSPGMNTTRTREALTRFVDEQVRENDLVAVMKPLDSVVTIRLTRNREEVRAAIARFTGCKGDYTPRTPFEASAISRAPDAARAARVQVVMSALHALTMHLGNQREGRKAIVLVSEGFAGDAGRSRIRLPDVHAIVRAAHRFDVAIYTFDPRATDRANPDGANGPTADVTMLRAVAQQTSGEAIATVDEFGPALGRVTRDLDAYYRLTYKPSSANDGGFHPIEVRVRRKGAQVRARSGYWALSIDELRRARLAGTPAAPVFRPPALRISPLIQPWFRMTRGPDGRTRVIFMWELKAAPPSSGAARARVGTLTLTATAADGTAVFRGRLSPVRGGVDSTAPTSAVLDAAPGPLALEMSIEDLNETVLDSDARTITVPDLNGVRTVLGTPEVVRTRTAVEFRAAAADPATPPTSTRVFHRSERLIIRAPAYGPAGAPATVRARLLNPLGHLMRELPAISAASSDGIAQFELLLASLPPGEYRIEVAAESGDSDARESFSFRVRG